MKLYHIIVSLFKSYFNLILYDNNFCIDQIPTHFYNKLHIF